MGCCVGRYVCLFSTGLARLLALEDKAGHLPLGVERPMGPSLLVRLPLKTPRGYIGPYRGHIRLSVDR